MKPTLILACLFVASSLFLLNPAMAQPPKSVKPIPHTGINAGKSVGALEAIEPKETEEKARQPVGWNGSYVGVNAGVGFGATAGTNIVVPLGGDSSDKGQ